MRARHVLLVCLLLVVGHAFAAAPANTIDTLADVIGLPAPGPVFVGDDNDIDDSSRLHNDLKKAALQTDSPRRANWAAGWLCAERNDFACALRQWRVAAQSAPQPPRWQPEAYALALWGLGRHEQAVAWYDTAVLGDGSLGEAISLHTRYAAASLDKAAKALYEQWREARAPLRKRVITAVDIDITGRVERVQVLDEQLDPILAQRIQQVIADWPFPPAENKGKPARLSTHVYVEVRGRPDGDQRMVFDVQFMGTGVRAVKMVGPAYPTRSLAHGKEGAVVVLVDINARGKVTKARLEQSSGMQLFDKAAVAAARRWRFAMDQVDGEPVASSTKLPFVFMIGEDADMPPHSHGGSAAMTDRSGAAL